MMIMMNIRIQIFPRYNKLQPRISKMSSKPPPRKACSHGGTQSLSQYTDRICVCHWSMHVSVVCAVGQVVTEDCLWVVAYSCGSISAFPHCSSWATQLGVFRLLPFNVHAVSVVRAALRL